MSNRKFKETKEFIETDQSRGELDHLLDLTEKLKKIHYLTTSNYRDFETLIKEFLRNGLELFDMEIGIVSRIDGDIYTVESSVSPDNAIKKGDQFELAGTYCIEVFKSNKVVGIPEVGRDEKMKSHPVYINMKLESYLSAPIYKNGNIFGTLNFTSTTPRKIGFLESDKELISMLAYSIGNFLEMKEKEDELISANQRFKKLIGFVAHDLRSPLSGILSIVEFFDDADKKDQSELLKMIRENSKKALGIVHSILETILINKGEIQLDLVEDTTEDPFNEALSTLEDRFKERNLSVKINRDGKVILKIDKDKVYQIFQNLLSNACKYGLPGSEISVNIKSIADSTLEFSISNIIDREKIKLRNVGTLEEQSVGLGLELVEELLNLHGSSLNIVQEGETFTSSFILSKD